MTTKPHPVPREDRQGTHCEDYELNGCSVDGCPDRCYLALPNPDEPMTTAEFVFVSALCQFYNPYPGPIAWLCRYAWIAYQTLGADTDIEIDNVIARQADWLNRPENTTTRTDLINSIRWLRHVAAKPPHWPLPDQSAFDASQWLNTGHGSYTTAAGTEPNDGKTPHNPRWQFVGNTWEIDEPLAVTVKRWLPGDTPISTKHGPEHQTITFPTEPAPPQPNRKQRRAMQRCKHDLATKTDGHGDPSLTVCKRGCGYEQQPEPTNPEV